tara:strand:+ start:2850 stop:4043 length:1194 start_codon:yes stop_codon:yes gene_type:complete
MNEQDTNEIRESIEDQVQDMISNMDPLFYHHYMFDDYMKQEIYKQFEEHVEYDVFDPMYESFIENIFIELDLVKRSYKYMERYFVNDNSQSDQVNYLKHIPQPAQKTQEWYDFRKKHLTGSNIWKLFSTESTKRQLIYEKLAPSSASHNYNSLSSGPLNWGHKYEPLSILFYEYYNDVRVEEFGCVPHKSVPFLAASPDGIVTSQRQNGRMLEIKNVVSREITKTPKMEYWIQMQLQMEVCDLKDCDFVETKFVEYDNENDFKADAYRIEKGMIMVFVKNNESYVYEYSPLFQNRDKDLNTFIQNSFDKYNIDDPQKSINGIKWFTNVFWKLDVYSCVYVPRNQKWFEAAYPIMEETWNLIKTEQEIEGSYLKYKAKSNKKTTTSTTSTSENLVVLD